MYTWDSETESQRWQEQHFESAYEAEQFTMPLMNDGVVHIRTFKEPFNR